MILRPHIQVLLASDGITVPSFDFADEEVNDWVLVEVFLFFQLKEIKLWEFDWHEQLTDLFSWKHKLLEVVLTLYHFNGRNVALDFGVSHLFSMIMSGIIF